MAVRFDATGDYLTRSTNLPAVSLFTIMGWVYISVDKDTYGAFWAYSAGLYGFYCGVGGDGVTFVIHPPAGSPETTGNALTVAKWYHIAQVVSGTGANQHNAYVNGVLALTGTSAVVSGSLIRLGNTAWGGDYLNGRLAAIKIYSAALTVGEISNEMGFYRPLRTTNLNSWLPMIHPTTASNVTDQSGNAYDFTGAGALTVEDGPPIAWAPRRQRWARATVAGGTSNPISLSGSLTGVGSLVRQANKPFAGVI